MPRKSRKIYSQYNAADLSNAVSDVKTGRSSLRQAAAKYDIPRSTISDHVVGRVQPGATPGRKPALPSHIEREMVVKAMDASQKGFGITRRSLMVKAFQVAKKFNLNHPFRNNAAGKDWFNGLKSRHPDLAIRKPQKVSTSRSRMMNNEVVSSYFKDLGTLLTSNNLINKPKQIWNLDETGISLEHTPQNVIAKKGAHQIPGRVSCAKENISVSACVNANGESLPPMIIVRGKTHKALWSFVTSDGPEGALWTWQERAWMEDALGHLWFQKVFLPGCGPERPQLLILDQHHSHEVIELIQMAKRENIIILGLPPHCSHWLQPLDKGCFGPLSKRYDVRCTEYMSMHPSNVVTKASWAKLFKQAWVDAITPENIKKGFSVTGIWPFNPDRIPQEAFSPYISCADNLSSSNASVNLPLPSMSSLETSLSHNVSSNALPVEVICDQTTANATMTTDAVTNTLKCGINSSAASCDTGYSTASCSPSSSLLQNTSEQPIEQSEISVTQESADAVLEEFVSLPVPDHTSSASPDIININMSACSTNTSSASCDTDLSAAQYTSKSSLLLNDSLSEQPAEQTVVSVTQESADAILEAVSSGTLNVFDIDIQPTDSLKVSDISDSVSSSLDEIFGFNLMSKHCNGQTKNDTGKKLKPKISGHRILTSDEIVQMKQTQKEEKEKKLREKEERMKVREENKRKREQGKENASRGKRKAKGAKNGKQEETKTHHCILCLSFDTTSSPFVECSNCHCWIHHACVPFYYQSILKEAISGNDLFICHVCVEAAMKELA